MRWVRMVVAVSLCLAMLPSIDAQPDQVDSRETSATILAIVDLEQALLERGRQRYESLARQRADVMTRIENLQKTLDTAVRDEDEPDFRRIELLVDQLKRTHATRDSLLAAESGVAQGIAGHLERLELLGQQLDTLRAERTEEIKGLLSGTWDLVLMPAQQRGTATLTQTGAVVMGTYQLDGGWTGSLQGTLVNRKVFLVRIDSRLGKSMELEGFLSADSTRIRGNWLNYELAGSEGSTGQWSAHRRAEQP